MHSQSLFFVLAASAVIVAIAAVAKQSRSSGPTSATRRALMSGHEQAMYWRLREAFPDGVVLAQVAVAALITSAREHRNRYDRKIADFVLCDKAMGVHAVIELDDASNKGRTRQDARRAVLLERAGYRVIRFARVPDAAALRAQLAPARSASK